MDKRKEYRLLHEMKLESYASMAEMVVRRDWKNRKILGLGYEYLSPEKEYLRKTRLPRECRLDKTDND